MNERTIHICLLHNCIIVYIYCAYRLYTRVAHQLRSRCGHHPIQFERQAHLRADNLASQSSNPFGHARCGSQTPQHPCTRERSWRERHHHQARLRRPGAARFICTVQGKGCFVAEGNQELLRENQLCHIEELLAKAASQAETLGVTRDKLHEMLDLVAPETMQ